MHKITFRLGGLDLREPASIAALPEQLAELSFEANGQVSTATLFTDVLNPLEDAKHWARALAHALPAVDIETYDELVSTSDIAARCEVSPESVRLWAAGRRRRSQPFPRARQAVGADTGGKVTNLYLWREVLAWVRQVLRIDPDEGIHYLDKAALRQLDAYLDGLSVTSGEHFRHLSEYSVAATAREALSCLPVGQHTVGHFAHGTKLVPAGGHDDLDITHILAGFGQPATVAAPIEPVLI